MRHRLESFRKATGRAYTGLKWFWATLSGGLALGLASTALFALLTGQEVELSHAINLLESFGSHTGWVLLLLLAFTLISRREHGRAARMQHRDDFPRLLEALTELRDADGLLDLGSTYFNPAVVGKDTERKDVTRAVACFDRALTLKPDHVSALFNKGAALALLEQYDEAVKAWDQLLGLDMNLELRAAALTHKATALQSMKSYDEALEHYEQALALEPEDFVAWSKQAQLLATMDRWADALDAIERSVGIRPSDPDALTLKGLYLLNLGRYKQGLDVCEEALRVQPDSAAALTLAVKGACLLNLQRPHDGLTACDRALRHDPECPLAWIIRGRCLLQLDQLPEASGAFDRARELKPDDNDILEDKLRTLFQHAARLIQTGSWNEALDRVVAYLNLNPEDAGVWFMRASIHRSLGDYSGALAALDQVLGLQPDHADAQIWRGANLVKLQRFEGALVAFDALRYKHPDDEEWQWAWHEKGAALMGLKRYDEALSAFQRALILESDDPHAWLNKGIVLYNLKRYSEARKSLRRAWGARDKLETDERATAEELLVRLGDG